MPNPVDLQSAEALLLLGEIKGLVQGLKTGQDMTNTRIQSLETNIGLSMTALEGRMDKRMGALEGSVSGIDSRLRSVEQKAAVIGAASGGAMALGTALIVEGLKYWLGRGAPGP